jgi:hypothetical protein
MNRKHFRNAVVGSSMLLGALVSHSASAAMLITEVDPSGSSAAYAADWFELTNTGNTAVDITGWKMDDNSNSSSSAVALRGVTSIAAGQSVIFIEGNSTGTNDASLQSAFITAWWGSSVPNGLVFGGYGGSQVGLSGTADAVNIFDSSGTLIANVSFGAATAGKTFDNTAGQNNATISTLSATGVNGAFASFNAAEIGSPGVYAPPAVPVPASVWMLFSGLGLLGANARRKRAQV